MEKFRDILVDNINKANVVFYGVPYDGNASISKGTSKAPDKIRELSYWLPPYSMLGEPMDHVKIYDLGDYKGNNFEDLFLEAEKVINLNKFKFICGGDHSISIPFQKAFIDKCHKDNKEPVIVHIDAHCDICDSYLGNKYSHACTVKRALDNGLKQENLFMLGIREFEKDGYDILIKNKNDVHLFLANEILNINKGLHRFFEEIQAKYDNNHRIYISFDIDGLDASYVPGTGTPETCGLTPTLVKRILLALAEFSNVEVIDLVEIAPPLDINDITSWCGIKLLYEFLGKHMKYAKSLMQKIIDFKY